MTYTRKDNPFPAPGPQRPAAPPAMPPAMRSATPYVRPKFAGLSRSAVALFRVGTRRARMAAALMIVAGSLLYQTGAEALQESSKKVLYLDAPSVSAPEAQKAGETARGYAGPDSNVDDAVLAWVDVKPVPREARSAFASITDPDGQPPGGVAYDDAVAAGDAMVAQLGGDSPAPSSGADDELASADPVRPKLGDGTKATDAPVSDDAGRQPNSGSDPQPVVPESGAQEPEYATAEDPAPTDLGLPAPMAEEYAPEPSTEQPAEQPPNSNGSELAAVSEEASKGTGADTDGNSDTGPISDGYAPDTASPDPSDGSADEAEPQNETEAGSSDAGPDPQEDEASPTIVVPDSPSSEEPGQEPEQEYAAVPEGSGTEPETSETPESETETENPENDATLQDEPSDEFSNDASGDPSSEPSPASTEEASVPAEDISPGSEEQEPEESSDLVAAVPYDPGAENSQDGNQEGLEQSSQTPEESMAEPSSGPSTDETESYSPEPEPGQQGASPEEAAASPTPAEEESTSEEPAGEEPVVQPEPESSTEFGAGEDTEDMGTDEELPEGVQIESSDEPGSQKLSVVVHQESETADAPGPNSPEAQGPPESAASGPSESEKPSPAPQEETKPPSTVPDADTNPEAEQAPTPDDAGESDPNQSADTPGRPPVEHTTEGHNAGNDSQVPQEVPGDQQRPSNQASPGPSAGADQVQPEATPDPTTGNEAGEPETTPENQGRQGDRPKGGERVSGQEPKTPTPDPAPAPKDQRPRQNAEEARPVQTPPQNQDAGGRQQQLPRPEQQQPSHPAREPRQSTAPAEASPEKVSPDQGGGTGAQGPTQSADAVPISAETAPVPAKESEPPTPTAATDTPRSNEAAPGLRNQPVVTAEPVAQPPATGQAEPDITPETAPAVQTSVAPAPEEAADPAGWVDPTQAAATRQAVQQQRRAARQAAMQAQRIAFQQANQAAIQAAQPIDTATQGYAEPVVEPGWDQTAQQVTDSVQGQGVAGTGVPVQGYSAQDAGTQATEVVAEVDSYAQEAAGTVPETATAPAIADPYAGTSVEPSPAPAASSYEAPAAQNVTGSVEDVAQEGYAQDAVDPYVEDVTADAAPAPEPATYGGAVDAADSSSYEDPGALPENPAEPARAETNTEPATQVPAQQLEPVQQVQTQELAPAPQVANVLESGPAATQPSAAPTNVGAGAASPAPAQRAQQQVASTVDAAVQQAIPAGGVAGGGK